MAKSKQHVFSARTMEEGLKLNELRKERGVGWDDLVIEAVCAHYNLDKAVMNLPKKEKPAEETQAPTGATSEEHPAAAAEEKPRKRRPAGSGKRAARRNK